MAEPHWRPALLAACLVALLLADAALGQTFTYSRGWKPGGKRSRAASLLPPLSPRFRALVASGASAASAPPPAGAYPDDAGVGPLDRALDRGLEDQLPVSVVLEALAERWPPATYEQGPSWRGQLQDHGQDDQHDGDRDAPPERYRHGGQGDHDDH